MSQGLLPTRKLSKLRWRFFPKTVKLCFCSSKHSFFPWCRLFVRLMKLKSCKLSYSLATSQELRISIHHKIFPQVAPPVLMLCNLSLRHATPSQITQSHQLINQNLYQNQHSMSVATSTSTSASVLEPHYKETITKQVYLLCLPLWPPPQPGREHRCRHLQAIGFRILVNFHIATHDICRHIPKDIIDIA